MSAFGTKRTSQRRSAMSAFGGLADIAACLLYAQKGTLELGGETSALCKSELMPCSRQFHSFDGRNVSAFCATLYPATVRSILVPSDCSLILPRRRYLSCAVRNHPVADLLPLSTLKPSCSRKALAAHMSGEADSISAQIFSPTRLNPRPTSEAR